MSESDGGREEGGRTGRKEGRKEDEEEERIQKVGAGGCCDQPAMRPKTRMVSYMYSYKDGY